MFNISPLLPTTQLFPGPIENVQAEDSLQSPDQLQQIQPQDSTFTQKQISLSLFDVSFCSMERLLQIQPGAKVKCSNSASEIHDMELINAGVSSEDTTLCSLAFSIIMSNNRKGYSLTELDSRLRAGYTSGSMSVDNCRVNNKLLFSVLAEIS